LDGRVVAVGVKQLGKKKSSGECPEQEGGGKRVEKHFSLTLPII
jgi:hypothetical protein